MAHAGMIIKNQQLILVETIAQLRSEFINLRTELLKAHDENARLKSELDKSRQVTSDKSSFDLLSLRRRVAFCCHPDRGGDIELMKDINLLFDSLLQTQN